MNHARALSFTRTHEQDHRLGELRQGLQKGRAGSGTGVGTNGRERGGLVARGIQNPRRNDQSRFFATISYSQRSNAAASTALLTGPVPHRERRGAQVSGTAAGGGLFVCQRIAEAHGQRIELKSEPGNGSTFRVLLPL